FSATSECYPLSLHDALPILEGVRRSVRGARPPQEIGQAGDRDQRPGDREAPHRAAETPVADDEPESEGGEGERELEGGEHVAREDRKSTRLNSSHVASSYAV